MGVITAVVGGIIRDVLGQEPSIILRREIYVTASLVGAIIFSAAEWAAGVDYGTRPAQSVVFAVFVVRGLAISFGMVAAHLSRKARKTVSSTSSFRECQTMIATPIAVP